MTYDAFIALWNGKQVTKYSGQCVALIAEFQAENNKPIIWADAALWANHPQLKAVYTWVANDPNNASQLPNRGDIIIWDGRLPYTNGSGHIAFYDHNLGNHQMMTFGQNSGGPSAHFQPHSWDYVAGWYVVTVPAVAHPAPAPAHPYQVVESFPEGRQFKVHPGKNKWGMNYDNLAAMEAHPVNTANENTTFIAVEKVHHQTGGMYYRAANDPDGWNVVDCDAFIAPPPPPPPYVPPAAPLPVPKAPQFTLVTTVMAFKNASDAANHNNAQRTLKAGTYYVFSDPKADKQYGMYNLTDNASKPGNLDAGTGGWINPRDNVLPEPVKVEVIPTPPAPTPAPTPPAPVPETAPAPVEPAKPQVSQVTTVKDPNFWKTTNGAINATRQAEVFYPRFQEDIVIHDLEGRLGDITFHPYQIKDGLRELVPVPIISTFWKDGVEYGRTPKAAQIGAWYGFPMSYFDYGSTTTAAERFSLGTAKFRDYIDKWAGDADRLIRDINVKIKERKAKK